MNKYWKEFKKGILMENPIFVLALSLCPALAVTTKLENAMAMGVAVLFVMSTNNLVISLVRKAVNPKVRMPVYITSIATIVTTAQLLLKAFSPELDKALGIYLPLVVVFAIILARAEVFASKNTPILSFIDGLGMGVGFFLAMVVIAAIREFFGAGQILGHQILVSEWYSPPLMIQLPPGAYILIGYLVAASRMIVKKMEENAEKKERAKTKLEKEHAQAA